MNKTAIDIQNIHKALAAGFGQAQRRAIELAKSPVAQGLWSGAKRVAHAPIKMMLMDTPKWMYPLYGAAAAAPIIGYEANKKKPEVSKEAELQYYGPEEMERHMSKASGAITNAISRVILPSTEEEKLKPEDLTPGLDNLKGMIQKAKERAAFRDNPEKTMRSGD